MAGNEAYLYAMVQYFFFVGDYLKGKPVYPVVRRILNLLFSISLSSFLFEKFYFKYTWFDITDYKAILDFFIKGYFFVPFSIFIIIHYFLDWLSDGFFLLITMRKSSKILKDVYSYEFKKSDYRDLIEGINENPLVTMPVEFNKAVLTEIYQHLATEISVEQWKEFEKGVKEQKVSTQESFKLALKALITITVYFFTVPHFGIVLYILVLLVLIFILFGLYFGYLLMEITPAAIKRFHFEVTSYLKSKSSPQNPNTKV